MTPDILYDQMIGVGARPQAGVLLRRQSRRRLAAPLSRRDRAWLAAPDRDRGAQPRRHGQPLRRRGARTAVRGHARLRRHRPGAAHARRSRSPARSPARSWSRCPRCAPTSAIVHAQEADREGNVQLWGIPGVQKEAVLAADRCAGDRRADRRRARAAPRGRGDPRLGDRRRGRGARRVPSVLQPGHHHARQRLLPLLGRDQPRPRRVQRLDARARARGEQAP